MKEGKRVNNYISFKENTHDLSGVYMLHISVNKALQKA